MTTVRVYVNGRGVDAPADGSALDAIRELDPALAEEITGGRRVVTDSRGLPLPAETALYHGAIYRVVSKRPRADDGA
ncbi:MAG: hypothetical protein ACT4P7_12080 [Gemmatimonadaceae bacterium]